MIKKIFFLSSIFGVGLAILALIPFVIKIAVFLLIFGASLFVVIYLQRKCNFVVSSLKDILTIGSLSGFISFIAFSIVFIPIVYLLSLFVPIAYMGGFVLMLKLSNLGLMVMFTLFLSTISVMFNAFSAFFLPCLSQDIFQRQAKGERSVQRN